MNAHKLLHEIWEDFGPQKESLHSLEIAGPRGDASRRSLSPNARLVATVEAGSHYEAMMAYHRILGREPYTTTHKLDFEPYPAEWAYEQVNAGIIKD